MNWSLKRKEDEAAKAKEQARWRKELRPQITHPKAEYTEEKIAALVQQMELANRFRWPEQWKVNL